MKTPLCHFVVSLFLPFAAKSLGRAQTHDGYNLPPDWAPPIHDSTINYLVLFEKLELRTGQGEERRCHRHARVDRPEFCGAHDIAAAVFLGWRLRQLESPFDASVTPSGRVVKEHVRSRRRLSLPSANLFPTVARFLSPSDSLFCCSAFPRPRATLT